MAELSQHGLYALKAQLICHEGLVCKPYKCTAGKLTIGVGRNLQERGITEQEAEYLLDNDITMVLGQVSNQLPVFNQLSEVRKLVLLNMAFNLGIQGLKRFKKMLAALCVEEFNLAAQEMLDSKWAEQVGYRAKELADMMAKG
ncbi:glycoside hydrolase family protein [Pseudoalteromonas sp. MMG012]|uniref:glycoside hydrolase family protein n=1 Tax=Pseudoalteromonas sp. MMG012 TaxID=2822686 RepID=UPI001B3A435F|nr:glycoside hydrolase family protein [Pseudoalteromonas sp. MMG012]MBQ4852174.1 glycoside hydrolase family protein [Pseudoalteromonas sp. MMG012]